MPFPAGDEATASMSRNTFFRFPCRRSNDASNRTGCTRNPIPIHTRPAIPFRLLPCHPRQKKEGHRPPLNMFFNLRDVESCFLHKTSVLPSSRLCLMANAPRLMDCGGRVDSARLAFQFFPQPLDLLQQFFSAGHHAAGAAVKLHQCPAIDRELHVFHHLACAQFAD